MIRKRAAASSGWMRNLLPMQRRRLWWITFRMPMRRCFVILWRISKGWNPSPLMIQPSIMWMGRRSFPLPLTERTTIRFVRSPYIKSKRKCRTMMRIFLRSWATPRRKPSRRKSMLLWCWPAALFWRYCCLPPVPIWKYPLWLWPLAQRRFWIRGATLCSGKSPSFRTPLRLYCSLRWR